MWKSQPLVSSCLSVLPCVWKKNSASTGRIFIKFDIWLFCDNLWRKIQVSLKSDKNKGYFTWRLTYICNNDSLNSCWNEKRSGKNFADKAKTHILCSKTSFFSPKNRAVYEILWGKITWPFKLWSGNTKIYYRKTVGHVFTKPVQIEGTTQKCFSSSKLFFIVVHISAARRCECM